MKKRIMIVVIALFVGALHIVTGENHKGPFSVFVNGYMLDILLPMTMFLLTGLIEDKIIGFALFRALAVFGFGCFVEASQYLGYPLFGNPFDPLDILAYASGVLLGFILDLLLFPRLLSNWKENYSTIRKPERRLSRNLPHPPLEICEVLG